MQHDFKIATRQLLKTPASTLVAVVTIALGIGASTAVFSLVNAVLLRSLPVPNPHELQMIKWTSTRHHVNANYGSVKRDGRYIDESFSGGLYLDLRKELAPLANVFAFQPVDDVSARVRSAAFNAHGMIVSDNFFTGLQVSPYMGQLFGPGDGDEGSVQNVVLTYEWWDHHFNKDPNVLGQTVSLNALPHTVIGVLPRDFPGIRPNDTRGFYGLISSGSPFLEIPMDVEDEWCIRLMARLKPQVTPTQLAAAISSSFASVWEQWMENPEILVESGRAGLSQDRAAYHKPLLLMLGIVGMVMLVVCANLTGLALARGAAKHHELAIRSALGSSRWRLMRLALTENLILALIGGGLGILIAIWGRSAIAKLLAGSVDGLRYDLGLDFTVLAFCLGLALATALLSGLIPSLRAARVDPVGGLKERGSLGVHRLRTARGLVVGQICLSLLLLFGAGLYARTFINLIHVDAGFDSENLLVFEINPNPLGYKDTELMVYLDRVQSELAALPGVEGATLTDWPLLSDERNKGLFTLSGSDKDMFTYRLAVMDTFFDTLGIPIMQGRSLLPSDNWQAGRVVVVNEAFARAYTPGKSPIGRSMDIYGRDDWRIVGVCRDIKNQNIKDTITPAAYFPRRQRGFYKGATCYVRTKLPALALSATVQKTVANIDPNVPIARLTTQDQISGGTISQERFLVTLGGSLAGVALLLSCIGIYGLMSCHVTGRNHEIAIRMAVGAQRSDVARPILREALLLAALGIAIGLPLLAITSRLIKNQLYEVQPNDPTTMGVVVVTLAVVALLAAWIPAWRATKVDPVNALRCQ